MRSSIFSCVRCGVRAAAKLARFAQQLQQQQTDREHRRQLIEFDQSRRRQLADFDRRIDAARSAAHMLEAQLKLLEAKLAAMRGFWNYFRRRRLAEEIEAERAKWDAAATQVTDLSDDRADVEERSAAAVFGNLCGRPPRRQHRGDRVCTAARGRVIQVGRRDAGEGNDLEARVRREVRQPRGVRPAHGGAARGARRHTGCERRLAGSEGAHGFAARQRDLSQRRRYRPADGLYRHVLPAPAAPVSGLETVNRAGVNVLVDDYWDVYQSLMQ